jgi:hypothetical protein
MSERGEKGASGSLTQLPPSALGQCTESAGVCAMNQCTSLRQRAAVVSAVRDCGAVDGGSREHDDSTIDVNIRRDLSEYEISLGWDFLVLASFRGNVNILVLPVLTVEGSTEGLCGIEPRLIGNHFVPDKDILCAYHRCTVPAAAEGQASQRPARTPALPPGELGGHYEAIAWKSAESGQPVVTRFEPGHPGHARLARLCSEALATMHSDSARDRMEDNYNRQLVVRQFKVMEGVGVRTAQGKRVSKQRGSFNLPAVIIQVVENPVFGKQRRGQLPRESYRLLTQFGLISTLVKADDLTQLTLNNHPELREAAQSAAAKMEAQRGQEPEAQQGQRRGVPLG